MPTHDDTPVLPVRFTVNVVPGGTAAELIAYHSSISELADMTCCLALVNVLEPSVIEATPTEFVEFMATPMVTKFPAATAAVVVKDTDV